jgi:hypothetical protein
MGMGLRFYQLVVDSHDPEMLGRWWATALGYDVLFDAPGEVIVGTDPARYPRICFVPVGEEKSAKNRLHIDLDPEDHDAEVARMIELGATPVDVGQGDSAWTVLGDPEGNEFCILTPHRSLVE